MTLPTCSFVIIDLAKIISYFFFFNDPPTPEISPLSLHDALPISRFVFTDYLGSLCWLACTTLLPIVVASVAGIRATAYFYLAWQIGYGQRWRRRSEATSCRPEIGRAHV